MRIHHLHVIRWRNFTDIRIDVPLDASLVCLVGENGTGKSSLLELVAAAAQRFGIAHGFEIARGNPFGEPHHVSISLQLSRAALEQLRNGAQAESTVMTWSGVLELTSATDAGTNVVAKGVADPNEARALAQTAVQQMQHSTDIHYLFLDADRAYPPFQLQPHQYAEALGQDLDNFGFRRQFAYRPTRTLYEEWIKYALAGEGRAARSFYAAARAAAEAGEAAPTFDDWFRGYKDSLKEVLPHLRFTGTSEEQRTLLFDSAGVPVRFWQLSGGEREIAFIIGQIERFKLRRGLLLLDEPELHLNPDLVRTWVAYLRDTIEDGQVWIATHALEAAEVTGPESTFVLQREAESREVRSVAPLGERPVLRVLSAALGSPGFSITQLKFVLIEGERLSRERERFHALTNHDTANRFIEAGNCREVVRKLITLKDLSDESGEQINIGGIIDRDFRTDPQIAVLQDVAAVLVLPCHEVENLFLHPTALQRLINRAGQGGNVQTVLQSAADQFVGRWILERTLTATDIPTPAREIRAAISGLSFGELSADRDAVIERALLAAEIPEDVKDRLRQGLSESFIAYTAARTSDEFWSVCLGKEMMTPVATRLGLRGADTLERHVSHLWSSGEIAAPAEVELIRQYIANLGTARARPV